MAILSPIIESGQEPLFGMAIRHGLTANDLRSTIFGYPTAASDTGYML
ncbi:MAG TPA: hypothetical protein VJ770_04990 [Stellaceae bacterium]|nr:hypothetical protein [Stellaceae bacterium]